MGIEREGDEADFLLHMRVPWLLSGRADAVGPWGLTSLPCAPASDKNGNRQTHKHISKSRKGRITRTTRL